MINELFRFVSERPPKAASPQNVSDGGEVLKKSPLAAEFRKAKGAAARAHVAKTFRAGADFLEDPAKLKSPLVKVAAAIAKLSDGPTGKVAEIVEQSGGTKPATISKSDEFASDKRRLLESILALRLSGGASSPAYKQLCRLAAVAKLIEEADSLGTLDKGAEIKAYLRSVTIKLPSLKGEGDKAGAREKPEVKKEAEEVPLRFGGVSVCLKALKDAKNQLELLRESHSPLEEDDEEFSAGADGDDTPDLDAQVRRREEQKDRFDRALIRSRNIGTDLKAIGDGPRRMLATTGLDLDEETITEAIEELSSKIAAAEARLASLPPLRRIARFASYQGHTLALGLGASVGQPTLPPPLAGQIPAIVPPALDVPEGVGYARILGMGDLLLVREESKSYELGEIAHVENVMRTEHKTRTHRRTEKTEEFFSTVTETETEKERDLESTERFQLSQEASEIIKADASLQAGFNLSASYGPTVSIGVSTSASTSISTDTEKRSASDFSREVTDRAKNRVLERVREERSRRLTQEIEEISEHGFDNSQGADHAIGVYRWIDKITRARLLNYGKRLLLEFIIPEPSAFFIKAFVNTLPKGITLVDPDPAILELTAADIEEDQNSPNDYRELAKLYQVTDLEPPPLKYVRQAENFTYAQTESAASQSTSTKVIIGADYRVTKVVFTRSRSKSGEGITLHAAAGPGAGDIDSYKREFSFPMVSGEIPLSLSYFGNRAVSVHVGIFTERTPQAMEKWQLKTYKALIEGYQKMKSAFNEQVAAASIRQSGQIQAFPPARNRSIERTELKRNVIAMLTGQQYDLFGAIQDGDIPQVDFIQAIPEGKYIQFFENSFEWTNMSYVMYPYFWGRKSTWVEKVGADNQDPDHLAFLQSGAARVVVPVRTGYREVIVHYLDTGEIWGGDEVPDLSSVSAPYVDVATEIREEQGSSMQEPALVDEWDVRLPTSLVILQKGTDLPVFINDK